MDKLLLWVPRFWPAVGGTEFHSHRLAVELASDPAAGPRVQVITHSQRGDHPLVHDALYGDSVAITAAEAGSSSIDIRCLQLGAPHSAMMDRLIRHYDDSRLLRLFFRQRFRRQLAEQAFAIASDADLVHFIYNGLTEAAELALATARRRGIPFVLTPNVLDTRETRHAWNSSRFKRLYREADRLIALTNHEAHWLTRQGAPARRIEVVPYGPILETEADGARFRREMALGEAPMILFLARITEVKGYDLLLAASHQVWRQHPHCRIVFMGPATDAARAAIQAAGDARLQLLECVSQQTKTDALASCTLLCLPSRRESLGGVIIEANALGKPAVTLDLPVLRDLVIDGETGLRVDEDPASLASALCRLLADRVYCRALGSTAQTAVAQRFAWPLVTDRIRAVYRHATGAAAH